MAIAERHFHPKGTILLTGAGFSKPFGGYLASEVWAIIFNQFTTSECARLRTLLRGEMSYEKAYTMVMSGEFSQEEKTAFTEALTAAYIELDRSIRCHLSNHPSHIESIRYFISRFAGEGAERGFVFTLNQDVLLERFGSHGDGLCQIPALGHPDWFSGRLTTNDYPETDISNPKHLEHFSRVFWAKGTGLERFLYIKLHGSYKWKSARNGNAMVIGHDKTGSIAKEPLLKWYFDIFQEVLRTKDMILVVVGYGFMDAHINQMIFEARNTGLQLHIVSPMQPKDFRSHILSVSAVAGNVPVPYGHEIWGMLSGYHCTSVDRMLPAVNDSFSELPFWSQIGLS